MRILAVYTAVHKMYNYYQINTPTAFGNPEYDYLRGYLVGLLCGLQYDIEEKDDKVIITNKHNKKLLIVEIPIKKNRYFEEIKDINKTLRNLGL